MRRFKLDAINKRIFTLLEDGKEVPLALWIREQKKVHRA